MYIELLRNNSVSLSARYLVTIKRGIFNQYDIPVRETSLSIMAFRRFINEDLVSNMFNKTEMIDSTSDVGQTSHMARANEVCTE